MPLLESKFVKKLWGSETWIVNNAKYCGKILSLNPGFQCSLHYHPVKEETFHVLRGKVFLEVWEEKDGRRVPSYHILEAGETYHIYPSTPHRFQCATGCRYAEIMEFSTQHDDADVVRIAESRIVTPEEN